ncbi:hypothetical protein KVT40_002399 [Elsinoe batatas]|uniref:Uncharacterized protein n=1 Tax=Elsinoe batatas TaxID=2601811 RepID=A0A8K0PFX8_9PEZI|nr:hypothetical protein KVT40_002399 [Elsinoe batatas]
MWQRFFDILLSAQTDSDKFESLVEALHDVQSEEPALCENARYTVRLRRAPTVAREKRLEDYAGPDDNTIELLESSGADWLADVRKFFRLESHTISYSSSCHPLIDFVRHYGIIDRDIV